MPQKLPIPQTEWTNEAGYVLMLLCCPNDPVWIGTVRGRVYELAVGRTWDEQTGRVTSAQAIGEEIWQSMATCKLDDLVLAVQSLGAILSGSDKIAFELSRINYNLDRIRDNLDTIPPESNAEYGLASVLAALGPNVTKSTEYLKHINAGINSNAVDIPDESGEFVEPGHLIPLEDVTGELTSMSVSTLPQGRIAVSLTSSGGVTAVKLMYGKIASGQRLGLLDTLEVFGESQTFNYFLSDYPDIITSNGYIVAIDQKYNILSDTY